MPRARDGHVVSIDQSSWEWAKLIRKLRWIGLEKEARRLERALSTLPPEKGGVLAESHGAD
jgi:hypothetical protein